MLNMVFDLAREFGSNNVWGNKIDTDWLISFHFKQWIILGLIGKQLISVV